ncbi:sigma-54 interaction domain-containing protein [Aneurinibacillus terranovensis]|uniref:sigma-54 interaction domain-containing protein n=1 Tax=Aneurinibacillus terranovensis TaxID=278991 RepID=UPI00068540C2|nr:sigma-54-dependent Fis family transcriptional regulator [Aneurinibacillus terranovensis]
MYAYILNEINEGVHAVDEHGVSIVYNRKMMEIESMEDEDVLHKNLLEVFQFMREEDSTLLQALRERKTTKNVKQTYFNDKGKEITTVNHTFPIIENGEILGAIEIANDITKMEHMMRENILKKGDTRYTFDSIIGDSSAVQEVIESGRRASRTNSSVLIIGETGTGKELFAQSIHNDSVRVGGPFISQNCAALPETLIESLLFGTSRGAFTGAVERPGLFEAAKGGTLLLDEINSLEPSLQAKLLRAIQERKIKRIGSTQDISIDVRIIATINEDPVEAITGNRLRKDLYYRLSVVTLFIPPLRERKEDIPILVRHFIQKYNRLFQMNVKGVDEEVLQFFTRYEWPGNVRELEHVIEGAMNFISNEDVIAYSHLPFTIRRKSPLQPNTFAPSAAPVYMHIGDDGGDGDLKSRVEAFERHYIREVIQKHKGNISRAAKEMGVSRQSLQYRMRKYDISLQ